MKIKYLSAYFFLIAAPSLRAEDIYDLLQAGRKENGEIRISEIAIEKGNLTLQRSKNAFLPEVSANYTYLEQPRLNSEIARSIFPQRQETTRFTGKINIFRGGQDLQKIESSNLLRRASEKNKITKEEDLDLLITSLFIQAIARNNDRDLLSLQIEELNRLDKQLKAAKQSGRIRASSLLSLKSKISTLKAEMVANTYSQEELISSLAELTKKNRKDLLSILSKTKFESIKMIPSSFKPKSDSASIQSKEDILAAYQIEKESIRGEFLPTISVESNYYAARPRGLAQDLNWDVALKIDLPIFSKLDSVSKRREASLKEREAIIELAQERDNRRLRWEYLEKASTLAAERFKESESALFESVKYSETIKREFSSGLATDTELIDATNSLFTAKRSLNSARHELVQISFEIAIRNFRSIDEIRNATRI